MILSPCPRPRSCPVRIQRPRAGARAGKKRRMTPPVATLTLDVEDWEHANFEQLRGREAEIATAVRARGYAMDANVDRWIAILAEAGASSTCFVLGEFAQRYPAAVRRLAAAGHEIASHGATHDLV